jgi:hypothetical protein
LSFQASEEVQVKKKEEAEQGGGKKKIKKNRKVNQKKKQPNDLLIDLKRSSEVEWRFVNE